VVTLATCGGWLARGLMWPVGAQVLQNLRLGQYGGLTPLVGAKGCVRTCTAQ
jgi:hypothetical protein